MSRILISFLCCGLMLIFGCSKDVIAPDLSNEDNTYDIAPPYTEYRWIYWSAPGVLLEDLENPGTYFFAYWYEFPVYCVNYHTENGPGSQLPGNMDELYRDEPGPYGLGFWFQSSAPYP
ncbi:MAG: hypothetical protein ACUVWP_04670 [bacterium]